MSDCANTVCQREAQVGDLCSACYQHERRTGEVRPEATIIRTGERQLMRELEAEARSGWR